MTFNMLYKLWHHFPWTHGTHTSRITSHPHVWFTHLCTVTQSHVMENAHTVYAIIFAYRYLRSFELGAEICEGLISRFSNIFITLNRHKLKCKFLQGLTREIHKNKTTAKLITYTVFALSASLYDVRFLQCIREGTRRSKEIAFHL